MMINYDRILIRFGEISTKGRNRSKFLEKLRQNVKRVLYQYPEIKIETQRDRMFVKLNGADGEAAAQCLKEVFGIQSFSLAIKTEQDIDEIKNAALSLFEKVYEEGKTFKITSKRADKKFELDTGEMNHTFGSHILRNIENAKVDVKNPDINLQIEVRAEGVYLSCENIKGAGGLPAGSSGKAMLMLSGGIDSPVAGYLALKRGIEVEAVHFHSPPFTSERAKQKVIDLTEKLSKICGKVNLHIVPFTEVQQMIQKQVPENYTMTSTRRMMLTITDQIRKRNEGLAIVTGESLGQVASQTLESMYAINDVTATPVLRPLITMDKEEIVEIAQKIDTFEISNRPFEDCCTVFVPASPKTKPKLEKVERFESFVDFTEAISKAVTETETLVITPGFSYDNEDDDLF